MGLLQKRQDAVTNLSAVTATGAGGWVACADAIDVLVIVKAASVTSGGTILLEGNTKADGSGDTYPLATGTAVAANGNTRLLVGPATGVPSAIRTNLSARTDGTFTTLIQVKN